MKIIRTVFRASHATLGGLLLYGPAQAQSENIVVTATRLPGDNSGSNVAVIDAATITARHPASVVDLLRDLPDVYVQQAGGSGSVVSLFTRGAKPNFTLVLLDGVKANDPTNTRGGSYDFSTLGMNDIDRIEFVRGPASAIYGSDAVGGVINIITRHGGRAPDVELSTEGGSIGYVRVNGHIGGSIARITGNLGLSYTDAGEATQGNTLKSTSIDGSLTLPQTLGINFNFDGHYASSAATAFPDSSGGPRFSILHALDHRDIHEGVLGAHVARGMTEWWNAALDYGFYDRNSRTASPGVAPSAQTPAGIPASGDKTLFTRHEINFTSRLMMLSGLDVAVGMDVQIEQGSSDGFLKFGSAKLTSHFALNRTTWAGFAEARYLVTPDLGLSGSLRCDYGPNESRYSPQLRADYALTDWSTELHLLWGKAYKRPSFYALGNPIVGDPNLRPEFAENFEVGITQRLWNVMLLKADVYAANYRDLIDFRPGAAPKLVNQSAVHVRGIEASMQVSIEGVWGALSATPRFSFTTDRNETTGAPLRDVPNWLAGVTVVWQPSETWSVSFDLNYVGAMVDNSVPTGDVTLDAHQRADVTLRYAITPELTLIASIDNIFDQRYEEVVGFPSPGAAVRAGFSASL